MLKIKIPHFCLSEIEYTLSIIFTEWLGIEYEYFVSNKDFILISYAGKDIKLNADFFANANENWLTEKSMPRLPLNYYNLNTLKNILHTDVHICEDELPVLYGRPEIVFDEKCINCEIDILGSVFFMISRYEEIVITERDEYDRFPHDLSISYKENFLFRPIVNEYVEFLFSLLRFLFPCIKRKKYEFKISPTHDVDVPFLCFNTSLRRVLKRVAGDIVRRKSLRMGMKTLQLRRKTLKEGVSFDPFYTFDFIMNESEKRNLKSSFYFLPSSDPYSVFKFPVSLPEMKNLLNEIDNRGHEIGIHGCFGTYLNDEAFLSDVLLLQNTMNDIDIKQIVHGGRQHFLQWRTPDTFYIWENAGMEYDSTLSFAKMPGFRCGTCYEYSVYDCVLHKKLKLKERPLVAMEGSVAGYMRLGVTEAAFDIFKKLKYKCKFYSGNFIILFHNDSLVTPEQKEFYIRVLDC